MDNLKNDNQKYMFSNIKHRVRYFLYEVLEFASKSKVILILIKICSKPISAINNLFDHVLNLAKDKKIIDEFTPKITNNLTVQQGVFKGLKYSCSGAAGSAFLPKIYGTYEIELENTWLELIKNEFDLIVDIGCAEGYYAVGCAILFPKVAVYAFDTNKEARILCENNARANYVEDRVIISTECTDSILKNMCEDKKCLIICDIEGGELDLFEATDLSSLKKCFLLIELHDGVNYLISDTIKKLFSLSHNIESIYSTDDLQRPSKWSKYNFNNFTRQELYEVMKEKRCHIMEWVFLSPR